MPTRYAPSAATGSSPCSCRAPSATSRGRSGSSDRPPQPFSRSGGIMTNAQELAVQQKKEVASKEEKTVPARYFVPPTDIYETAEALTLVMEMPGVDKKDLAITLEDDVLRV